MSFFKYLEDYEQNFLESVKSPKAEIKNPVKNGLQGKKDNVKSVSISKPSGTINNPVNDKMQGKKDSNPNVKVTEIKNVHNYSVKDKSSMQKNKIPASPKVVSPKGEMDNKTKSFEGKICEKATSILDGLPDDIVLTEEIKKDLSAQGIIKDEIVDKAESLL